MSDMKSTGIIRRVDDLGRIVIPKEVRRRLNIHEGEPRHDDYAPDFLWHEIGQHVTQLQLEMLRLKSIGLTAKEISDLYSCTPKAIYCRVYRLKKKLRKKAVI